MIFHRRRREEPRIDLTSLVDVVFLLLIFFMISTTFVEAPGLGIQLPRAGSRRAPEPQKEVTVALSRDGAALLAGRRLDDAALEMLLRQKLAENPKTIFVLQADQAARHGRVVEVMDLARRLGYGSLAIATAPRAEKE